MKTRNKIPFKFLLLIWLGLSGIKLPAQETLTLNQALEAGLQNNFSIIIQRDNAQIATNNNTIGNAGFLPGVTINATQNNTITTTHQETFSGSVKDISGAKGRTLNAGVQLSWTLFDGFSMFVAKDMLNVMEEMGETEVRMVIENTISSIVLTYYGIVQEQKLIHVLQDAINLSLERKTFAEARLNVGAGSALMLLQATTDLNSDSINLIQELAVLDQTKADLNRLLARDPAIAFGINDSIVLVNPLSYEILLEKTRGQNSDLLIARNYLDLSYMNLKDAQSQRYPRLNFQAGYDFNHLKSQTGFLEYNRSLGPSCGVTLSYPIFNGMNVNRSIQNARISIHTSENQFQDAEMGVTTDLYKTFIDYKTSLQVESIETLNQDVARENLSVAYEKYRLGTINDIELRETQKKYIDAQYQLLLAQFKAKQAEIELLRISGELYRIFE